MAFNRVYRFFRRLRVKANMASNTNHPLKVTLPSEANPPAPDPTLYVETNEYAQALMRWAAENGHAGVIEELLDQGHSITSFDWKSPQHLAVQNGHLVVTELLIRRGGASVDCTDRFYQRTSLSYAAENGDEAMARLLLSFGAMVNAPSFSEYTPLSWAAENGHLPVARLLLDNGADVELHDACLGQRPLTLAAKKGRTAMVELLLDKGADVAADDYARGLTALHWAAYKGHIALVELLVERGAEVDCRADCQLTPLFLAAANGHDGVVELLLKKGANPQSVRNDFRSPCSYAAANGFKRTVGLLLDAGADIESRDNNNYGQTLLSFAASRGHIAVVRLLIARGADKKTKDHHGRTPLSWATDNKHDDVVQLLLADSESDDTSIPSHASIAIGDADSTDREVAVSAAGPDSLCDVCSKLDFVRYFSETVHRERVSANPIASSDAFPLGSLPDLITRSACCSFCYLAVEALRLRWSKSRNVRLGDLVNAKDRSGKNVECRIFSFTTGRSGRDEQGKPNPQHESYNIGLSTTRETNWYRLEGSIALMREGAEKIGRDAFGYGRLVPAQLDRACMRSWLSECEGKHEWTCRPQGTEDIEGFLVIDTETMCIVDAPKMCRFLALSYCWGSARVFRLEKRNRETLRAAGSIKSIWGQLPQTIRDAITLCGDVGERYLWVDSICIIQDDDAHRSLQIAQMDKIYQSATLTIVCTDGTHANYGLPGVAARPRSTRQVFRDVRGMRMAVSLSHPNEIIDSGPWNTRAWTYQERCLSRRLLCLTESQAFFICGEKIFCEDTILEGSVAGSYHRIVRDRPKMLPRGTYTLIWHDWTPVQVYDAGLYSYPTPDWNFVRSYQHHLYSYTRRQISDQSDILDAFRGVIQATNVEVGRGSRFWQGLPELYFEAALLWTTVNASSRRQVAATDVHAAPRRAFPSWSWSGWIGEIDTPLGDDIGGAVVEFQSAVDWHLMNEEGHIIRLEGYVHIRGIEIYSQPEHYKKGLRTSRALPNGLDKKVLPRDGAREAGSSWQYPPYLLGWTRVAEFALQEDSAEDWDSAGDTGFREMDCSKVRVLWPSTKGSTFCILQQDGRSIGRAVLDGHPEGFVRSASQRYEFILASRMWLAGSSRVGAIMENLPRELLERLTGRKAPWPLINVILVQRSGSFAERIGVGFIHEEDWQAAQPEEIFVTLR